MTSTQPLFDLGPTTSRTDLVSSAIRTSILDGTFQPGDVLVERHLAEQYGVSKTPVREALIMLERSRLLVSNRNRGMTVRTLTLREIRHVYEERLLLEPWALGQVVNAGATDFSEASRALEESSAHVSTRDPGAKVIANRRFHRALYSKCENELVVEALDRLQDLVAFAAVSVLWPERDTSDDEAEEHQKVLDAAIAGADGLATELLRDHIQTSITRVSNAD